MDSSLSPAFQASSILDISMLVRINLFFFQVYALFTSVGAGPPLTLCFNQLQRVRNFR